MSMVALVTVARNARVYDSFRVNVPGEWLDEDGEIREDRYERIADAPYGLESAFTLYHSETGDTCDEPEYNIWIEDEA